MSVTVYINKLMPPHPTNNIGTLTEYLSKAASSSISQFRYQRTVPPTSQPGPAATKSIPRSYGRTVAGSNNRGAARSCRNGSIFHNR